eukprot:15482087-Alexandrium_andersonii.AAC.1
MAIAAHGPQLGQLVLHAADPAAGTWVEARAFSDRHALHAACRRVLCSMPPDVVAAVVYRDHGWGRARKPLHVVTAALRRHYVVMSGAFERVGQA